MVLGKKKAIVPFCILLLLISTSMSWSQAKESGGFHKKVIKDIEENFGKSATITNLDELLSEIDSTELSREGDRIFLVRGKDGKEGFILMTSALGRYDYFDYTVIYHADLSVLNIRITTYRSSHGAGICSKHWLKQFKGYSGGSLELGKDIDAVSGGTISAGSLVKDLQRCYLLMSGL